MRRILFFVGAGVMVVGISLFLFFSSQPSTENNTGTGNGGGLFGSLFPFGQNGGTATPTETPVEGEPAEDTSPVPQLRKVSASPTVGGVFFEDDSGTVALRYIDRATGHVFEARTDNRTVRRVSNTTIPEIQEATWVNENTFIIRYLETLDEIETFFVRLASTSEEQALDGSFVSSWNRGVLNPQKTSLLSVTESSGDAVVSLSNPDGSNRRVVLSSPIRSWVPLQSRNTSYVYSAPSSGISGSLYRISSGELIPVVRNVPGLVAQVTPDDSFVIYSQSDGSRVSLFAQNIQTGEIFESPVETLASKCVVLDSDTPQAFCGVPDEFPGGAYPDDWYTGKVALSDSLWRIDFQTGSASLVALPDVDAGERLDVLHPFLSADNSYAGFINKNDLSFWIVRLNEEELTPPEDAG